MVTIMLKRKEKEKITEAREKKKETTLKYMGNNIRTTTDLSYDI